MDRLKGFSCALAILTIRRRDILRRLCYHIALRGCRQVVRHELPKLAFAGSSPVTRSRARYSRKSKRPAAFLRRNPYIFVAYRLLMSVASERITLL